MATTTSTTLSVREHNDNWVNFFFASRRIPSLMLNLLNSTEEGRKEIT